MKEEIPNARSIEITNLYHAPGGWEHDEKTTIWDEEFIVFKIPPKVYIIETKEELKDYENITFTWENTIHTLQEILIYKEEGDKKMMECIFWKQEYL